MVSMKKDDNILERFSKEPGFRVPDGYFENFAKRMADSLPEKTEDPTVRQNAVWLKIRPWVYMAAMFGGVWCMMYLFSDMKSRSGMMNDSQIAEAMNNETLVDHLRYYEDFSDYDILKDIYDAGVSTNVFDSDSTIN